MIVIRCCCLLFVVNNFCFFSALMIEVAAVRGIKAMIPKHRGSAGIEKKAITKYQRNAFKEREKTEGDHIEAEGGNQETAKSID